MFIERVDLFARVEGGILDHVEGVPTAFGRARSRVYIAVSQEVCQECTFKAKLRVRSDAMCFPRIV